MAMNLKKKEGEAQRLLHNSGDRPKSLILSTDSVTISPDDTKAIIIHGRSPSDSYVVPPASMPVFLESNEFGHVRKLNRKTSLKVGNCKGTTRS